MLPKIAPVDTSAWQELKKHYEEEMHSKEIKDLFKENPKRFEELSLELGDIFVDFSKSLLTGKTLELLIKLAQQTKVKDATEAMFNGEVINETENRPVLHVALR